MITAFLVLGHHNATYTVVKTSTGIEFKKVRQIIPIPNAKANHIKVCTYIVSLINQMLNLFYYKYCEIMIINNCGVLIFADFVVHLDHEKKNPTKFPIDYYL
jgi:hypothetical protein